MFLGLKEQLVGAPTSWLAWVTFRRRGKFTIITFGDYREFYVSLYIKYMPDIFIVSTYLFFKLLYIFFYFECFSATIPGRRPEGSKGKAGPLLVMNPFIP